jgi:hypothetical protein
VGIAEDIDLRGWQLIFMRANSFDDQDVRLGQDTYCIVSGNQEGTAYGGVVAWSANGSILDFTFTLDAAQELGVAPDTAVTLDGPEADVTTVVLGLEEVLGPPSR